MRPMRRPLSTSGTWIQSKRALEDIVREQHDLRNRAKFLTLGLYRNCLRSVKAIRWGNDSDERDFKERERKRIEALSSTLSDPRLSLLSMLPPVDRQDELRSRAAYYKQFTRETITQESDCFGDGYDAPFWKIEQVERFLHYLSEGEKQRQWLLRDMKYDDPVASSISEYEKKIDSFGERAREFCDKIHQQSRKNDQESLISTELLALNGIEKRLVDDDDDDDNVDDEDEKFWFSDEDTDD